MRPSNKRSKKETESSNEDGGKESPRIIWFKPTDKRVPLIAIPVEQAPEGFLENSEAFENRLFLVTFGWKSKMHVILTQLVGINQTLAYHLVAPVWSA